MKSSPLLILAACGARPPAAAVAPPAPPPVAAPVSTEVPPEATAGVYWSSDRPYAMCEDCAAPAAIAAYITPDERAARAIRSALDGTLGLGLPYVVYTDELAIAPRGIAVVVGTFGSMAAAERAAAASPVVAGQHARAIAIDVRAEPPEAPRRVTVVDRGGPVQAWSKADVDAAHAALAAAPNPPRTQDGTHAWLVRWLAARPAACSVLPGDLFVVEEDEIDWYELAPVRCNGRLAYIEWTQSLLGRAVIVRRGATHTLTQMAGMDCDSPFLKTWRYDAEGRHEEAARPPGERRPNEGC